ncbi:efflux RND transporter periplasmic adaptor subunit [Myxococcus hansupus]|uniref:efflux RND transporter periplasmic adaptor subunit n=1 Tax=Pseudomyxococcus hansupus TaxID=1297742 RepID=UPI0009E43B50
MVSRAWSAAIGIVLASAVVVVSVTRLKARNPLEPAVESVPTRAHVPMRPQSESPTGHLGVIVPQETVDISSPSEGLLMQVPVHVGDALKQGDVIARLDLRPLERELAISEAELLSARADLRIAELGVQDAAARLHRREDPRQLSLGAISEEELMTVRYENDLAVAKKDAAQARVREQEARASLVRQRLSDATIRAPFEGVVASRYVDPGRRIQAGEPLVLLLSSGAPQVRFALPEEDARQISVGASAWVHLAGRQDPLEGRVTQIAPEVDAASRMILVIAQLKDAPKDGSAPAGSVVRVAPGPLHDSGTKPFAKTSGR